MNDENDILLTLIAQNTTDIASIEALIATLDAENDLLAAQIAANSGDIATLQSELAANTSLINTLQSAIVALQSDLSSLGSDVTDLQAQVDNNEILIDSLQAQITNINGLLAAKQNVINGSCPSGYSIRQINANGSVVCEYDDGGSSNISRVVVSQVGPQASRGAYQSVNVQCPSGYTVTGGGYHMHEQQTQDSRPSGNGWHVGTFNNGYFADIVVYANCIRLY